MTYTAPSVSNQVSYQTKDCGGVSLCAPNSFFFFLCPHLFHIFRFDFIFSRHREWRDSNMQTRAWTKSHDRNLRVHFLPPKPLWPRGARRGCKAVEASGETESPPCRERAFCRMYTSGAKAKSLKHRSTLTDKLINTSGVRLLLERASPMCLFYTSFFNNAFFKRKT